MSDTAFLAGGFFLVAMQFAGPFLLARLLRNRRLSFGQVLSVCLGPGALLSTILGIHEHDFFPNLLAGTVMTLPPALLAIVCLRWSRPKPNGLEAFAALLWWGLSSAWFFAIGGFIVMGLLAATLGNTGSDGVLGTAIKIGALGGGLCGAVLGGPVGMVRLIMLANRQPSSVVLEPGSPASA